MKTLATLLVLVLIIGCATTQLNRPKWRVLSDKQLSEQLNIGPWTSLKSDSLLKRRGYIQLVDMGESFKHELVNELDLYVNGGVGAATVQVKLDKVDVDNPQFWTYDYDNLINQLMIADIDTTRGKCQGVLEVHYDNNSMVYFVAPSYLAFDSEQHSIELIK